MAVASAVPEDPQDAVTLVSSHASADAEIQPDRGAHVANGPGVEVVTGYHGTSRQSADVILRTGDFIASRSPYEWLGDGIYFFQDGPLVALDWARQKYGADAVVLRSRIQLVDCIDLVDVAWWDTLTAVYDHVLERYAVAARRRPRQGGLAHGIDCEAVNVMCQQLEQAGFTPRSVRSGFIEGVPIRQNSAFFTRSHIQVCVRDQSVIESTQIHEVSR